MVLRVNKFLKINIIDVTFDSTFSVTSHFNPSVSTVESTLKIYSKVSDLIIHQVMSFSALNVPMAFHQAYSDI